MPARLPAAGPVPQLNSFIERLPDFLLRLSLAVKRAEPLADRRGPVAKPDEFRLRQRSVRALR